MKWNHCRKPIGLLYHCLPLTYKPQIRPVPCDVKSLQEANRTPISLASSDIQASDQACSLWSEITAGSQQDSYIIDCLWHTSLRSGLLLVKWNHCRKPIGLLYHWLPLTYKLQIRPVPCEVKSLQEANRTPISLAASDIQASDQACSLWSEITAGSQ